MLTAAPSTGDRPDAAPPAIKPGTEETGATVADARRLARKAKTIALFYWTGPADSQRECLFLKSSAFLRVIAHKQASQAMPCRLHKSDYDGHVTLLVGVTV
jgi:hypothetical protein